MEGNLNYLLLKVSDQGPVVKTWSIPLGEDEKNFYQRMEDNQSAKQKKCKLLILMK